MSTLRAKHRVLAIAGFGAAVVLLFWAMAALSAWVTREHLAKHAQLELATLRSGQPLWQWRLRGPGDLVAHRVFGNADIARGPNGLRVTSRDGSTFDLGLPVAGPVDLAHWPLLHLQLQSDAEGTLGLIYQTSEFSTACTANAVGRIPPHGNELVIDLRSLSWHSDSGKPCRPPDVVTYLLRLRPQLPAHAVLQIGNVDLQAAQPAALPVSIAADMADIRLPSALAVAQAGLTAASAQYGGRSAPLVRLPAGISAETMLSLRDLVKRHWPGALVLPFGQAFAPAREEALPGWLDWGVCAAYLIGLVWIALRQTREVTRPWLEIAAIAAGPLWLIAGLRWGTQLSIPGVTAFVAALVFAAQSDWRRRPVWWRWLGRSWADWLWPLVPLAVTVALTLVDGHGLVHLEPRHMLAYLGWALLQQWAMLAFVMGRLRLTALPQPVIILITAALFGLLHTPNGSLMQLCFMAELWWAWRFLKSPCLVPIAVAHAICALLVESGLTGHMLRSLGVSARFFL
ncbi:MAG TPA: CPBP family glutamic-type intramembrane protease [Dyella sp.]